MNVFMRTKIRRAPMERAARFPMEACISGWAMNHGEVIVIGDIYRTRACRGRLSSDAFVKKASSSYRCGQRIRSGRSAPLVEGRHSAIRSVHRLQRLANAAAVSIANVALTNSLAAARDEAARARDAMILAMASLAETRDHETGDHIKRTQHYVRVLADLSVIRVAYTEGLNEDFVDATLIAPLHDIGKVGIPDRILQKLAGWTAKNSPS